MTEDICEYSYGVNEFRMMQSYKDLFLLTGFERLISII